MREGVVPGVSIALVRDGRLAWRRGFGVRDAASRMPVDDDTVFEIASVSKTVFAYAVMQLVDRRTIALDTPLTAYTAERILTGDPRLDMITARRVLSHTTGLQDWRSSREPLRIAFTPGDRFSYSGEGYWYLQSVVTHLTGKVDRRVCGRYEADLDVCATDIDAYMKSNILRPFGMASSGYVWNGDLERHTARPHDAVGRPLEKHRPTAIDAARYAAAGGLNATATDYASFLVEVIAPRARDAFHLAAGTRREMLRPQVTVDASHSWALGWEIRHTPAGDLIQHQGGQSGFQAFTAANVERRSGYVILTNSDNGYKVYYDKRFTGVMDRFLLV
jgi:CubicO group peptidase (beta-lactamase class C family)